MPDHSAYLAFLNDPDQATRWAELRDFIGPNAEKFLPAYEKLREDTNRPPGSRPKFRLFTGGFEVAAFFLGPVWFFYRKMWAMAWVIVGLLLVLAFMPVRTLGLVVGILLATMAHRTYLQHAIARIVKLHAATTPVTPAVLQTEGGVSRRAGVVSGVLYGALWLAGALAVVYLAAHGVDPSRP